MKKDLLTAGALLVAAIAQGGPAAKPDPVAAAYPDWRGVTAENLIAGRESCASDLRHKAVVVVEVESGTKLKEQLRLAAQFASRCMVRKDPSVTWDKFRVPREKLAVVSVHGPNARQETAAIIKAAEGISAATAGAQDDIILRWLNDNGCVVGEDLTFPGAPDNGGQYPFVYVLGPDGKEPLYKGVLTAATVAAANAAVQKAAAECAAREWKPYLGTVRELKYPQLTKALAKGQPLDPVMKSIVKDVLLPDEAKAQEAQILFDAVQQTKIDLLLRIELEKIVCPYRAAYDIQEVLRHWPYEKKRLEPVLKNVTAGPDAALLAQTYCRLKVWDDPDFRCKNAGEAKKIVQELGKMKKAIAPLKDSSTILIQDGALLIDLQLDDLLATIPMRIR